MHHLIDELTIYLLMCLADAFSKQRKFHTYMQRKVIGDIMHLTGNVVT